MITKKDFEAYVKVQMSGVTNMCNIGLVSIMSGLSRDQVLEIIGDYNKFSKKYPDVRK